MNRQASTSAPCCLPAPAGRAAGRAARRSAPQPPRRQGLQRCRAVAAAAGKLLSRSEVPSPLSRGLSALEAAGLVVAGAARQHSWAARLAASALRACPRCPPSSPGTT